MENKKVSYLWLIPITLLFPMIQNIIFFMRFAKLPTNIMMESLIFAPMGLILGTVLIYLLRKDVDAARKKSMCIGALVAMPFAIYLSIISGLLVPPIIATTVFGTMPLIIGALIGYSIKKKTVD